MGVQLLHFSAENNYQHEDHLGSLGSSSRCPGVSLHPNPVSRSATPNKTAKAVNAVKTMAVAGSVVELNLEVSTNSNKTVKDLNATRTMPEERREQACRSGLAKSRFVFKLNSIGKNGWKLS